MLLIISYPKFFPNTWRIVFQNIFSLAHGPGWKNQIKKLKNKKQAKQK
jgi:hypothetical protein